MELGGVWVMSDFEKWFESQDFYTNMRFNYGNNLFNKELGVYCILPVQIAYKAWSENQSKIEQLEKRISNALKVLNDASPTMLDKKAIRILRGAND